MTFLRVNENVVLNLELVAGIRRTRTGKVLIWYAADDGDNPMEFDEPRLWDTLLAYLHPYGIISAGDE